MTNQLYTVGEWKTLALYECALCPFSTLNEEDILEHIEARHIGTGYERVVSYICAVCGFETPSANEIQRHLAEERRQIHSLTLISFRCHECGFEADSEQAVRDHVRNEHRALPAAPAAPSFDRFGNPVGEPAAADAGPQPQPETAEQELTDDGDTADEDND
jgi:hypothetical protein